MELKEDFIRKIFCRIFIIAVIALIVTLIPLVWFIIAAIQKALTIKYCLLSLAAVILALFLNLYLIIPCICDLKYVLKNEYPEEDVMVVESDTSHEYSQEYCLETRLNSPINGLIVTRMKEFEPMKCYKVRYLPKTKIIEVISCTGNIFK